MWAGISHIIYSTYTYVRLRPREKVINRSKSVPKLNPTLPQKLQAYAHTFALINIAGAGDIRNGRLHVYTDRDVLLPVGILRGINQPPPTHAV
jgi:hypothetical protein